MLMNLIRYTATFIMCFISFFIKQNIRLLYIHDTYFLKFSHLTRKALNLTFKAHGLSRYNILV